MNAGLFAQTFVDNRDFGTRVGDSLSNAFTTLFGALPNIIGALLMLLVGWIIASVVAGLIVRALHAIKFNNFVDRTGATRLMSQGGVKKPDGSAFLGTLVKWFIFLFFVLSAANILGVAAISNIVTEIIAYLPNVVVAIFILLIGSLVGQFVGRLVYGLMSATGEQGTATTLARIAHYGVFGFFIVMALNQLGIATNIITLLFAGIVFGLALAFGLAFGLGGRDAAARAIDKASGSVSNVASRVNSAPAIAPDMRPQTPLTPPVTPPVYGAPTQVNPPAYGAQTQQQPYVAPNQPPIPPNQNYRG